MDHTETVKWAQSIQESLHYDLDFEATQRDITRRLVEGQELLYYRVTPVYIDQTGLSCREHFIGMRDGARSVFFHVLERSGDDASQPEITFTFHHDLDRPTLERLFNGRIRLITIYHEVLEELNDSPLAPFAMLEVPEVS